MGSFVWTHLTNLQESNSLSPHKQALKALVGSAFLQNKWNTDARKFSRNFEASHYFEKLGLGTTLDGNLVFSQESYVPRSAMVNLSVNVFGENLNLLEVGGRVEGLEDLIEGFFGPDGRFRDDNLQKLLKGLRRDRRSLAGMKVNNVGNERAAIAGFEETFNQFREEEPKGSLYLRMFGRDVGYQSFSGTSQLLKKVGSTWPASLFFGNQGGGQDGGQKQQRVFSRSSMFLDGSIVVPTVSGLALRLSVNGTSSVNLQSSSSCDLAKLFTEGKARVDLKVYPTASVQVAGLMAMSFGRPQGGDGGAVPSIKTGLKSVFTLHTSTFLDGQFELDGGKLVMASLNMPKDKMEVLDVSSKFFSLSGPAGSYVELGADPDGHGLGVDGGAGSAVVGWGGCTSDLLSKMLGIQLCARAKYPDQGAAGTIRDQGGHLSGGAPSTSAGHPYYYSGPMSFNLGLKKTDVFDKYVVKYAWTSQRENGAVSGGLQQVYFVFDTPGSKVNRRSDVEVKFEAGGFKYFEFGLSMPMHDVRASAVFNWEPHSKTLKLAFLADQSSVFVAQASVKEVGSGKFDAEARFAYLGEEYLKLITSVLATSKKYGFTSKLESKFIREPILLSGKCFRLQRLFRQWPDESKRIV